MPQMNVGSAGVEASFDAERTVFFFGFFKTGRKCALVDNVDCVTTKEIERVTDFGELPWC